MNNAKKTREEKLIESLIEYYGASGHCDLDEITGELKQLPLGTKVQLPPLPKFDKENRIVTKFMSKELFVKLYKRTIGTLGKELSYRNFTWFVTLSEYVGMWDCVLYDEDGNYMTLKKLSSLMEVDYDNLRNAFKDFTERELIKKIDVPSKKDIYKTITAYAVNPYLYMNGEYVVEEIRKEFADTRWAKMYD